MGRFIIEATSFSILCTCVAEKFTSSAAEKSANYELVLRRKTGKENVKFECKFQYTFLV